MSVAAELRVPLAKTRIVCFRWNQPCDDIFQIPDVHRLDLSLSPRPPHARGCYPDHWSLNRFERMGEILFVPAGEAFHIRDDGSSQDSINCELHAGMARELLEHEFDRTDRIEWTDRRLEATLDIRSGIIRTLILRLGEEARNPGLGSRILAELIAGQLVIELFRYGAAIPDDRTTGGLAPWRLRIIDERLAEHCVAPTLAELAGLCGLSVRQLTRGFRRSRGASIGEYVVQSQMNHAKRLLATDESIKSIAYSMGFNSPTNFSAAFRRSTGQTPGGFRQSALRTKK